MAEKKQQFVNEEIKSRQVRLIASDGKQVGIINRDKALEMAYSENLDLVQITEDETPVCKILDYNKMKFERKKKEKEQKKNQAVIEIKEIQISRAIAENDMLTRASQIEKFLAKGNHIRITMRLRGREISIPEAGVSSMKRFLELLKEHNIKFKMKQEIKVNGRNIECSIQPK